MVLLGMLFALGLSGQARAADPVVAAVGDMGCTPSSPHYNGGNGTATRCRERYVSDLLVSPLPTALLDLGDNQYEVGALSEFQTVYHPTFGRANSVAYPSLGNAEYGTPNAQGFYDYFSSVGVLSRIAAGGGDSTHLLGGGYYSFNVGNWHLIALNSNCDEVGGCFSGSPQETWLRSDLAAHPNQCTLAYWHHPRWNSGTLGNDGSTGPFWTALYNARADIVLNGHGNHHYERHLPQTPAGVPDTTNGLREFIVSTGGESHGTPPSVPGDPNTLEVADYTSFGILRMTLRPTSYDWQFVPEVGGSFSNSGTGTCHAAGISRPSAPSLTASAGESNLHLAWTPSSNGGSPITGYKIYRGTSAGGETLLTTVGNVTSYDDTAVNNDTRYYYRVAAVNSVGEGAQSNETSATPVPPSPFPSTGVLDSFNRAAGSLGSNWQSPALQDPSTVTIASTGLTRSGTGAGSATWSAGQFDADQEAYLTVPALPAAGNFLQVAGRVSTLSAANVSCYFLRVTPSASTWELRSKLNGNNSVLLRTFTAPFATGDSMGLRITGSTITAFRKAGAGAWSSVGSTADPSIPGGGYVSFTLQDTTARGGAFGGGSVTSASTPSAATLSVTPGDARNSLSWAAPSNGGSPITNYKIYRGTSPGGGTLLTTVGNVTSYEDSSAVNGTRYYYRVAAVNGVGEGPQSNEVSATATPSVSIDDVSTFEGNAGQTDFTFTATLTNPSSQPVTVGYTTQNGTATTAGSDYTQASGTLSFDPGQTEKSVAIKVSGDTTFEPDENFSVKLSGATNATIADDTGVGTIRNDDAQPQVLVDDVSHLEGDAGTTAYTYTLALTNPSAQTVTVDYATQDGTATTAGSDYTAASGTLSFDPGQTSRTVTVAANGDTTFEPDEGFTLNLSGASGATIADDTGLGSIRNDDAQPQALVNDVSVLEGDTGQADLTFTVSLTNPSDQTVTVDYATEDGTATTAESDYAGASGSLTFDAGQTSKSVIVQVNGDTTYEVDEDFTLGLTNATNATIADDPGRGTIRNDDPQPQISIDDVAHTEGDSGQTDFTFTVSLAVASGAAADVGYATEDGTATAADSDYTPASGTLSFAAGETSKTVTVKANGDTGFEPDEDFTLRLSNPAGATIADNAGLGSIANDDAQPQMSVSDVSRAEGASGTTDFAFLVSLSNPSAEVVTVDLATADGSATSAGLDYQPLAPLPVTFLPGATQALVSVTVNGDTTFESDESFSARLTNPANATIADDTGLGSIRNDDAQPQALVNDVSVLEGDTGQADLTFTVSLTNPSDQTVTVDYATEDGTATTAESDYAGASGSLTFDAGQTSKSVTVQVNGDTTVEAHETFTLTLSGAINASLLDDTGLGTIQNDDRNYPRPKAATPAAVSLVHAYQECTAPNRVHGAPLAAGGSCNPPVQTSPNVTSGTFDANGGPAGFVGSVRLRACAAPSCADSDVAIDASLGDVRCQPGLTGATTCAIPNNAAGPDYTGELGLELSLRMTDKSNAVAPGGEAGQGTVADITFPASIPCLPTVDTSVGAGCALSTTANTLVPGAVRAGSRAIWELGLVKVNDAGPDGQVSTADGVAPFAVQGIFAP